MMTFLPFADFSESANNLDKRRLHKQVIEAKQMLCALKAKNLPEDWVNSDSYGSKRLANHPATKAWKGYEEALKCYYNSFLRVALYKGINLSLDYLYRIEDGLMYTDYLMNTPNSGIEKPWWLGIPEYHRSHRARLLHKNHEFYSNLFSEDDYDYNSGCYWYPCSDGSENFYRQDNKLRLFKDYLSVNDLSVGKNYMLEMDKSFKTFRVKCLIKSMEKDGNLLILQRLSNEDQIQVDNDSYFGCNFYYFNSEGVKVKFKLFSYD